MRSLGETGRCKREILDCTLEEDGRGKLEDVAGASRVALLGIAVEAVLEECAAELHGAERVADKRMKSGIESFDVAVALVEYEVFARAHSLRRDIVRIHALPAAGHSAAVENHGYAIVVGIGENLLVELHCLLLVAGEEIDLDTLNAMIL